MIDAGKEVNAERYLGRFLDARSTLPPSFLIISHLHEDHYGGAFYLMSKQGLSALYVRAPTAQSLAIEDTSSAYRRLQEEAALHDVQFIDPDEYPELNLPGGFRLISLELEAAPEADENGRSLFQRLEAGETRLLFTGDLGAVDEERLLRKLGPEAISCEILKVPHHGSKHSSTEEFIEASGAEIAVICVGKNRYGHPSQEVIARLETAGMEVFRTDLDGDVCLDFDRRGRYRIQRSVGRRFRSFLEAFDWHFRSRRPLRSAHG